MATNFNTSLTVNKSHFQSRSKLSSLYGTLGNLQQSSWYEASVTTAKASTPVAIHAIAAVLRNISLALLLTHSDNVGLELTTAFLGLQSIYVSVYLGQIEETRSKFYEGERQSFYPLRRDSSSMRQYNKR